MLRSPAHHRPRRKKSRDGRAALGFLAPSALGLAIFVIGPVVASFVISLFDWSLLGEKTFLGFDNYIHLLTADPAFYTVLRNTLVFVFIFTPLNIGIALVMAMWLQTRMYGRGLFRLLFFLPTMVPAAANAIVWTFLLKENGVFNQILDAVGLPTVHWLTSGGWAMASIILLTLWQTFGYNLLILSAGLTGVPESLYEAAHIDGANRWVRFTRITLPMLTPSLFFTSIMTVIGGLQIFAQPYLLTNEGGPGQSTNTIVLYLYQSGFENDALGYASAIGWVLFVVVMLITGLQFAGQRKWVTYDR